MTGPGGVPLSRAQLRAQILAGRRPVPARAPSRPVRLAERPDLLPMTDAQRRVWFADALAGPAPVFTLSADIRLRTDFAQVERACLTIVARHAALRTAVVLEAGVPWVRLRPVSDFRVEHIDLGALSEDAAATALAHHTALSSRYRFDAEREPLVRFSYVAMPGGEHRLLFAVHHLTCDGDSLSALVEELISGRGGEPDIDYPDYAVWLDSAGQRTVLRAQTTRRGEALRGAPEPVCVPADLAPGPVRVVADPTSTATGGSFEHPVEMAPELVAAVRAAASAARTTDTVILFSAWARVVAAWTGQTDLVMGLPVSIREHESLARVVGLFVNTALVRVTVDPAGAAGDTVRACSTAVVDALGSAHAPLESVLRAVYGSGETRATLGVCFNKFTVDPRLRTLIPRLPSPGAAEMPLVLEIADDGQQYQAKLIFDPALYRQETISRLARAFLTVLTDVAGTAPRVPADRAAGAATTDRQPGVHRAQPRLLDVIRQTATAHPARPAVDGVTDVLSYPDLVGTVDALVARLRAVGIRPGDRVVADTTRGVPALVALLACVEAEAVYVPLSRRLPALRRADIVTASDAAWEVSDASGAGLQVRHIGDPDSGRVERAAVPGYLIFTSGSTGVPHGVHVATTTLAAHARGIAERLEVGPQDRYLQFADYNFDPAIEQFVVPLLVGATLVLRGDEPWDPAQFGVIAQRTGVTVANLPTPWFAQFATAADATWPELRASDLRTVMAGGDVLTCDAVAAWARHAPAHVTLLNAYGPTEAAITATIGTVVTEVGRALPARPSIGAAVPGHDTLVVDARLRPVDPGEVGELYAGGLLATGYWADPRRTARAFVPHPASPSPGARAYRTRDLVRHSPSGAGLEFLRRADTQVKVRGVRVELAEVETALLAHPDVAEAAATVTDGYVVGWVALVAGGSAGESDLRTVAASRLPHVAVPRRVHILDSLPRASSEKIDRQALRERPVDLDEQPEPAARDAGPGTGDVTLDVVVRLTSELLATTVGPDSDFFACGGDSLSAGQLAARCSALFACSVEFATVFAHPTPRRLAAVIADTLRTAAQDVAATGVPAPSWPQAGSESALTPTQQRFWFAVRWEGAAAQMVAIPLCLAGPLDPVALRTALRALVQRHGVLRSRIVGWGDRVRAEVLDVDEDLLAEQLTPATAVDADAADALVARAIRETFDLRTGWFRPFLTALADGGHVLHLAVHHIAVDGDSVRTLVRELLQNYDLATRAEPISRGPAPQYPDVARSQAATHPSTEQLATAVAALTGTVDLDLSAAASEPGERATVVLGVPAAPEVAAATARRHGVTPYSVVVSAWQRALTRWSGQTGFAVGLPVSLRDGEGLDDVPGPLINTLAVRAVPHDGTTAEHLTRVQASLAQMYACRFVPFEQVVSALASGRPDPAAPLFQTLVAWQADHEPVTVGALRVDWFEPVPPGLPAAMVLVVTAGTGGTYTMTMRVDTGRVSRRRASELVELLVDELTADELAAGESGITPGTPAVGYASVVDRLAAWVADRPRELAVGHADRRLDFAQLGAEVTRVADGLRAAGVRRGQYVLVSLTSRLDMLVVAHALWRLGAVYVPLGATPPPERVRRIATVSRADHLISDRAPAEESPLTHLAWPLPPGGPRDDAGAPPVTPHPAEAAYVIHTSGSTGEPRGVVVEHGQLAAFLDAFDAYPPWSDADCLVGFATSTFDASILELCWPAARGTAVFYPAESVTFDPSAVAQALDAARRHGAAPAAFAAPSLWYEVLRVSASSVRGVAIAIGGELVPSRPLIALRDAGARPSVVYGPTEATIICAGTGVDLEPAPQAGQMGRALGLTRFQVRDADWGTGPVTEGELYVAGPQVARGYLGSPRETAVRFLPDPDGTGARVYRTGDRVRTGPDGALIFVGRSDDQVKVRGVRVELGEIEVCLSRHPAVEAVAAVLPDGDGGQQPVAAVVARTGAAAVTDLAGQLRALAQEHLVPQAVPVIVEVPRLPVNANGKIDRRVLTEEVNRARMVAATGEPATDDPVARVVAAVWTQTQVVVSSWDTDFFAAGGHSIALLHVVENIERIFGIDFPLARAFEARTVRGMADEVRGIAGDRAELTADIALEVFGGDPQ